MAIAPHDHSERDIGVPDAGVAGCPAPFVAFFLDINDCASRFVSLHSATIVCPRLRLDGHTLRRKATDPNPPNLALSMAVCPTGWAPGVTQVITSVCCISAIGILLNSVYKSSRSFTCFSILVFSLNPPTSQAEAKHLACDSARPHTSLLAFRIHTHHSTAYLTGAEAVASHRRRPSAAALSMQ